MRKDEKTANLEQSLLYAFENLPYPDTLIGNREYDKARIALGIGLYECRPVKTKCDLPRSIKEALNSGDGTYKP